MNVGLNIGYSQTKYVANGKAGTFPSVTGTPEGARFAVGASAAAELRLVEPVEVLVGEDAVQQSRFTRRPEGRDWPFSPAWLHCAWAALTEITTGSPVNMNVVTGLPVSFYDDKSKVEARLAGEHRVTRKGRSPQIFRVQATCIPEPFGALVDVALNEKGGMRDAGIATGTVGVLDVGGHTTNLLTVYRMREIGKETASIEAGGWDIVRKIAAWLNTPERCPDLKLRDHQIVEAILRGSVRYYGQTFDIRDIVAEAVADLTASIMDTVSQVWNVPALDAILVTGGGGALVWYALEKQFRAGQLRLVDDPILANARGFWKYAHLRAGA